MDKLRMIKTFVLAVQNRSFAGAAEQLGISPSLVSKQVAELEASLGVRLLSRTTRRMEITEIGQRYVDACTEVLRDLEAAEDAARDMQREAGGTITVRAPHSITVLYVGKMLAEFSARYPGVEVHLVVDEHPANAVLAAQRGLDVAFHLGPLESDKLAARRLATVSWNVYGSKAYLDGHGTPLAPDDLYKHNCLVHATAAPDRAWSFEDEQGRQVVTVSGTLYSASSLALRQACAEGAGLAMLPSFCVAPYREASPLVRVLAQYRRPTRDLHLLVSPDRRRPQRIRLFIDFAVAWFNPAPWDEDA